MRYTGTKKAGVNRPEGSTEKTPGGSVRGFLLFISS